MLSDKLFHIYLIGPTCAGKTFLMRCLHEKGGVCFNEQHKINLYGPYVKISDAIIVMISLNQGDDFCRFKYCLDVAKLYGNGCPVYVVLTHYLDIYYIQAF